MLCSLRDSRCFAEATALFQQKQSTAKSMICCCGQDSLLLLLGLAVKILAEHLCLEPGSSQATLVTVLLSPTTLHKLPKGQWQRGPCLCPQLPPCSPPSLCCPGAWCCCRCSQVTLELQPSVPGQPGILCNASLQLTSWGNACLSQRVRLQPKFCSLLYSVSGFQSCC